MMYDLAANKYYRHQVARTIKLLDDQRIELSGWWYFTYIQMAPSVLTPGGENPRHLSLWRCHTSCRMRRWLRTPSQPAHLEAWQLHGDRCPGFLHPMSRSDKAFQMNSETFSIIWPSESSGLIHILVEMYSLVEGTHLMAVCDCSAEGLHYQWAMLLTQCETTLLWSLICVCLWLCALWVFVHTVCMLPFYWLSETHWDTFSVCKVFSLCINASWSCV